MYKEDLHMLKFCAEIVDDDENKRVHLLTIRSKRTLFSEYIFNKYQVDICLPLVMINIVFMLGMFTRLQYCFLSGLGNRLRVSI